MPVYCKVSISDPVVYLENYLRNQMPDKQLGGPDIVFSASAAIKEAAYC